MNNIPSSSIFTTKSAWLFSFFYGCQQSLWRDFLHYFANKHPCMLLFIWTSSISVSSLGLLFENHLRLCHNLPCFLAYQSDEWAPPSLEILFFIFSCYLRRLSSWAFKEHMSSSKVKSDESWDSSTVETICLNFGVRLLKIFATTITSDISSP